VIWWGIAVIASNSVLTQLVALNGEENVQIVLCLSDLQLSTETLRTAAYCVVTIAIRFFLSTVLLAGRLSQ